MSNLSGTTLGLYSNVSSGLGRRVRGNNLDLSNRETDDNLVESLLAGGETRNVDFKSANPWPSSKLEQAEVVRDILAMSNTEDGGFLLIGVDDKTGRATGITPDAAVTWEITVLGKACATYGSPPPRIDLIRRRSQGLDFVILRVHEFAEVPIVCKQASPAPDRAKPALRRGGLYVRSAAAETVEVADESQLRDLLERGFQRRRASLLADVREIVGLGATPAPSPEAPYLATIGADFDDFGDLDD